ncbi:hypothetical protein Tco_1234014, partial [Tanacetum coccineum]
VPVAESSSDGHPLSAPKLETRTLSATPSQGSSADDFYESQTIDSATAMNVYVPNWCVTNNARVDNSVTCRNLLDHVTPPGYWAMLRNQHDAGFLYSFNINSAQHQRDAEVAELKAKLEKLESKAAKVEELRKRVSDLEAAVAVKVGEAASLTAQNAGLLEKVSALELELDDSAWLKARGTFSPNLRSPTAARLGALYHTLVYLPQLLCIQEGLEAGVVHGRAGRSLTQIEAYNLKVKGKYVAVVFEFEGVSFPLLDELESLKDSPLVSIMSALILKDDQGNTYTTPEFARFQPSLDQVTVPIYSKFSSVEREMLLSEAIPAIRQSDERRVLCLPSSSALGGTSGFVPPHDSPVGITDYQVSTLVLPNDGGPTDPSPVDQLHDDLFDTSVLDKSGDV